MPAKTLAEKLFIRADERNLILNPPEGYLDMLPDGLNVENGLAGEFDFIQIFAIKKADLDAVRDDLIAHLKPDGKLWICWPKNKKLDTDLNRDTLVPEESQIHAVTAISIDDTWSGLRFKQGKR